MTPGNIPRLIETLKAHAGDDKHIACEDAFRIARDLDVPLADVGRTCNELGLKVMQCQLGCFCATVAERARPALAASSHARPMVIPMRMMGTAQV
jgi:hypothetical protein